MAHLYINHRPENESEEAVLRQLTQELPDDYVIVANVLLMDTKHVPEIDLVVIKETAVITVEVKGWAGPITGNPAADQLTLANSGQAVRNPIRQADKQAKRLAAYLRQEEKATAVFGDPRLAASLYVLPVVIFAHPEADVQLPESARVPLLHLDEAVAALTDPDFKGNFCQITEAERHRLGKLLLNQPLEPLPVLTSDGMAEAISPTLTPSVNRPRIQHQPAPQPPANQGWSLSQTWQWLAGLPTRVEDQAEQLEYKLTVPKQQSISNGQLAQALEKEMEHTLHHLLRETIAHNQYTLGLSTADFAHYQPLQARLEAELVHYLQEVIESRGYRLLGKLAVELVPMTAVAPGKYQVQSRIFQASSGPGTPYLELAGSGRCFDLDQPTVRIGRARDNDICLGELDQQRIVSRHHAEIRQEDEHLVLYDCQSTRGTYVAGQRLNGSGHRLQEGDTIILGPTQRVDGERPLQGSLMFTFRTVIR